MPQIALYADPYISSTHTAMLRVLCCESTTQTHTLHFVITYTHCNATGAVL